MHAGAAVRLHPRHVLVAVQLAEEVPVDAATGVVAIQRRETAHRRRATTALMALSKG
jgi:hypothetical protein